MGAWQGLRMTHWTKDGNIKERICVIPLKEDQEEMSNLRTMVLAGSGPKGTLRSNEDVSCLHLGDGLPHLSRLFKLYSDDLHLHVM